MTRCMNALVMAQQGDESDVEGVVAFSHSITRGHEAHRATQPAAVNARVGGRSSAVESQRWHIGPRQVVAHQFFQVSCRDLVT